MKNIEWFKKTINEMTAEEISVTFNVDSFPWCEKCPSTYDCKECAVDWLNEEYIEPMPELEVGMMVHVRYSDGEVVGLGIIRNWNGKLIVTYENGGFDPVDDEDVIIDAIYKAPSFFYVGNDINFAIWRRNND